MRKHLSAQDAIEVALETDCFSIHDLEANWKNAEHGYRPDRQRGTKTPTCTICKDECEKTYPYDVTRNYCTYREHACLRCLKQFERRD